MSDQVTVPKLVFENSDLMVVNKPFGMVVNRADTTRHMQTLQDWIEEEFKDHLEQPGVDKESEFFKRAGIVHRLDKETSGALIVAINEQSFVNLQGQFKAKTVEKMYVALCHGKVTPEEGTIDVPVGRLPWNRKKFGVHADGRQSITNYKAVKNYVSPNKEQLTLVHAYPVTGRTHQIRVHMRYLGFPIFGDFLYAGRKNSRRDRKYLNRHFLHAKNISFTNPSDGERLNVEAELPPELVDFLSVLQ